MVALSVVAVVVDAQRVAFERVLDLGGHGAGEAHIAVGADVGELDAVGDSCGVPDVRSKPMGPPCSALAPLLMGIW